MMLSGIFSFEHLSFVTPFALFSPISSPRCHVFQTQTCLLPEERRTNPCALLRTHKSAVAETANAPQLLQVILPHLPHTPAFRSGAMAACGL